MFQWDRHCIKLAIPAARVLRLYHSLGQIQVALPDLPSQLAMAYLCAYSGTQGVRVAVVFHLLESRRLAFYRDDPDGVSALSVEAQQSAGMVFVESLGFLLADAEIHLLDAPTKAKLWDSLPLAQGGGHGRSEVVRAGEGVGLGQTGAVLSLAKEGDARAEHSLAILGRLLATL